MPEKTPTTVQEYLDAQHEEAREALLILKKCILDVVPTATELLNYNIPAYALREGGKREEQIMIAGYKKSVGLYPHPTVIEKFARELQGYKKTKGGVQFPLSAPLPTALIKKMIQYRLDLITA